MVPHCRARHVVCMMRKSRGRNIEIVAQCQLCGDRLQWLCHAGPQMANWRLEQYVNMHLHGRGRPILLAMPRGA
ncbi:MAG: hypothetical protein ACYTEQ_05345 [Planctomycetota bacterium]